MKRNASMVYCKMVKRSLVGILVTALVVSLLSGVGMMFSDRAQAADGSQVTLHNPVYDSGVREVEPGREDAAGNIHNPVYNAETDETIWDCVWFGNYWQNDTNGDGVADKNDEKEPIKWRVLSVDGDDVFLLADKNLDVMPYNTEYKDVTWETCTLRSWLNGYGSAKNDCGTDYTTDNFIDNAFSVAEYGAIKNTNVVNENSLYYGYETESGNNTTDKVYLLSIAETSNPAYGFCNIYSFSYTRMALNTAYADEKGAYTSPSCGSGLWWLRSPGRDSGLAACIDSGGVTPYSSGQVSIDGFFAIRPALHLTLTPTISLSYAGAVCSDGTEIKQGGSEQTSAPTNQPSPTPTLGPTNAPTAEPIVKPTADVTERPVSPTKSPVTNMTTPIPAPGQVVKDTSSKAFYQIISAGVSEGAVSYLRSENNTKKAKVPAVIYHDGKKYKVTSIAEKAFAGNKKLKTVIIGKNVKVIQKKAFAKCKTLSKITIKSKVLDRVAKNAFKGTNKKLIVKVPKKKKVSYQKLFKGKGNKKLQVK